MPSESELQPLVRLYNERRFDSALVAGNALLAQYPDDPMLNNMLGVLNARLGKLEDSLACYDRALSSRPGYAEAFNNRGNLLLRLGQRDEAIASFEKALAAMPTYVVAHNNLGNALHEAGRVDAAVACFRKALQLEPKYAEAHNNLGNALLGRGSFDEAADCFARALRLQPNFAQALVGLGKTLNLKGDYRQAVEIIEKSIQLEPRIARWHNELGNALVDAGRVNEAIDSFRNALELEPEFAEVWSNLGNAQSDLGQFEAAAESYERAVSLKPRFCEAHLNLSAVKTFTDDDAQLAELSKLANDSELPESDRYYVNFALGKAYEDLGEIDKSFAYYAEGNRLRKQELQYDISIDREEMGRVRDQFDRVESLRPGNVPDGRGPRPIFIVGMPRSGTSLVEQILASHSSVYGAGELQSANRIMASAIKALAAAPDAEVSPDFFAHIRQEYLADIDHLADDSPVVTDKMPGNFLWTGFLLAAMPEARVVNIRRNPVAICWSMYRRLFTGNGFTNDLGDLGEYYHLYEEHMAFWHAAFPGQIFDLDYEQLTENQEQETRKLLEYCDLPWENACIDFHKTKRAVRTQSASQVRKKMYQGSSKAWEKYATHLGPLLATLKAEH